MMAPGYIRLDVLGEFNTTLCPCFDLVDAPITDSSGLRIHPIIRQTCTLTNTPTTPPPSPLVHSQCSYKSTVQSVNQFIIFSIIKLM